MHILIVFALQAAGQPTLADLEQTHAKAEDQAAACVQNVASKWWVLPDDAGSIGDAAVLICEQQMADEFLSYRSLLIGRAITQRISTQGLDQVASEHKKEERDRLRALTITAVLGKRFENRSKK